MTCFEHTRVKEWVYKMFSVDVLVYFEDTGVKERGCTMLSADDLTCFEYAGVKQRECVACATSGSKKCEQQPTPTRLLLRGSAQFIKHVENRGHEKTKYSQGGSTQDRAGVRTQSSQCWPHPSVQQQEGGSERKRNYPNLRVVRREEAPHHPVRW